MVSHVVNCFTRLDRPCSLLACFALLSRLIPSLLYSFLFGFRVLGDFIRFLDFLNFSLTFNYPSQALYLLTKRHFPFVVGN